MHFFTLIKLNFLYILVFIGPNKLTHSSLVQTNQIDSKKMNECQRCKVVTESFNKWLEETSRGKHEGGDAAWEEAKLKSYARSEMRLVEIQENLCSELKKDQDDCYALSEEAEPLLEIWWFHENRNNWDLYTWLCIENLKYCCPSDHYGESCTPCPHKINNKICSGNGKCNGEGTRKGDGSCICKKGYKGSFCDKCAINFYYANQGSCKQCHRACNGCTDYGEQSCINCAVGWSMDSGICIDNNECLHLSTCNTNEYCLNKEGSYVCKPCHSTCAACKGPGVSNCTSCASDQVWFLGQCVHDEFKKSLLINCYTRVALYLFLLILVIILFKKYLLLASITILILTLFIYYFENNLEINLINVISNLYHVEIYN